MTLRPQRRGLMAATRAVFKFLDKEDLSGRHMTVLGVGKVGSIWCVGSSRRAAR